MLIKREQSIFETTKPIQNDMKPLNLFKNYSEVYQCQGRIQGDYPIYIPRNSELAEKIVQQFHKKTLHWRSCPDNDRSERPVLDSKIEAVNEKNN